MEKIRSGQSFLYRKDGLHCTVIDVRLSKNVNGAILTQALLEAMKRYPYLASKLMEKDGDFYIVDNQEIALNVRRTKKLRSLGSMANGYHLIEIAYYKEHMYISFHHALCDGVGIKPFVETLLYYYICKLDHKLYEAGVIRTSMDSMYLDEKTEPFLTNYQVPTYENPNVIKDGFVLPEYVDQITDENIRFELDVNAQDFINFAKKANATPAILMTYFFSKAIYRNNKDIDKPVLCNMATDLRNALALPHTHKNCVGSMYLPFYKEDDMKEIKEVCITYRAMLEKQRQEGYVKEMVNSFCTMNARLDACNSLKMKKDMLSFFDTMTLNSYVLSYLGAFHLIEGNTYVDAIHFYREVLRE